VYVGPLGFNQMANAFITNVIMTFIRWLLPKLISSNCGQFPFERYFTPFGPTPLLTACNDYYQAKFYEGEAMEPKRGASFLRGRADSSLY